MPNLILAAALPLILSPEAPFVEKPVELETPVVAMADGCIRAGTKTLTWQNRDDSMEIGAEGHAVAKFMVRVKPTFPGWQPFVHFKTSVATGVVTRTYAFGMTKEKKGSFTQTIAVAGSNAVVVSRFDEPADLPLREVILSVGLPTEVAAGRRVRFTDMRGKTTDVAFPPPDAWYPGGDRTKNLWERQALVPDPVAITFDPDHPARSYTLRFAPGGLKSVGVIRARGSGYLYLHLGPRLAGVDHRMEVSFGRTAKLSAGDCVLDGINFTKNNDFEVPRWGRRNLLNNPSFESNTRYWHGGCFTPSMTDEMLVREAHSGRFAVKNGAGMSFSVPTKPNRRYTFSCWAKCRAGDGGTVEFRTCNYTWSGGNANARMPLGKGTTDWQRVTHTFDWPYRGIAISLGVTRTGGDVLIDDVQLEEGDAATDFEMPPFGVALRTDAPDGFWGDVGQAFNPRVVIRGAAGAKGVAKIRVNDFFGRETWKVETPFGIGADGETEVPACPETAVAAKGVHRIRVELDVGDGRPFVDHLRLARFRYATGQEPNRELHQIEGLGWMTRNMLKYSDVNWRRYAKQGVQVFTRTSGDWWGVYDEKLRREIAEWTLAHGGRVKQELFPQKVRRDHPRHPVYTYMHEEGIAWDNMPDVTKGYGETELAAVERAVCRVVREQPWCLTWIGTSELGVLWEMTKRHDYRAYARMMMAAHRGLKRANPKAVFLVHGTCNAGEQGRAEQHEFLEATKAVDPDWAWDGLQVHPYRSHPEFPSLEGDLEKLYADMARHNMPRGIIGADEGAYFFPLVVKEWNDIAPWAGTLPKDMYRQLHTPSYDLGWGERVATAMLLRYNLQCYRFLPRLRYVTSWNLFTLDVYAPWAVYVGTAAETELLGYAKFKKCVRFGDGARANFYDDGRGNAVAAIWKFNVALDRGSQRAAEMRVDAAALDGCEVFDMMANRCEVEKACGGGEKKVKKVGGGGEKVILPLSNFPFYLRVPEARRKALERAVETCTTSDDGKVRKAYDPPPVAVARCGERPDWSAVRPFALPYAVLEPDAKRRGLKWNGADDLSAECRMAWNAKGLFLRVDAKDDAFVLGHGASTNGVAAWYGDEGVRIFFDNLGDGRENFAMEMVGFAEDDSVYELLPTNATGAVVYRRLAPDIQQTGGVGDILRSDAIEPAVRCDFRWDPAAKTRTYEAFFPARQLQPLPLRSGARFGCSLCVSDRDGTGAGAKQAVTDVPPSEGSANGHPHLFSNFILR